MSKLRRRERDEAGVASVFVLALTFALAAVAWGAGAVAAAVIAHRTAQNAADLTALAAAQEVTSTADGCLTAAEVATANHARLVLCQTDRSVVTVEVAVANAFGFGTDLHARARAGPAP